MNTPGTWSTGQRALLRFVEREGLLAAPVEPPAADAPSTDDALFAILDAVVEQTTLAKRLAERLRLPFLDGRDLGSDAAVAELLKADVAQRCGIVVVAADDRTIEVASANPLDIDAVKTVEFAAGRRARVSVTTRAAVQRGLARLYGGEVAPAVETVGTSDTGEFVEADSPATAEEIVWTLDDSSPTDQVIEAPTIAELPQDDVLAAIATESRWTIEDEVSAAPAPVESDDVAALLALLEPEVPRPPAIEPPPCDVTLADVTPAEPASDEDPTAALSSEAAIDHAIAALLVDILPATTDAPADTIWSAEQPAASTAPADDPTHLETLVIERAVVETILPESAPLPTPAEDRGPDTAAVLDALVAPLDVRIAALGDAVAQLRSETSPRLVTLEAAADHWARVAAECLAIPRVQDSIITAQNAIGDLRAAVSQLREEAVRQATAGDHGIGPRLDALAGELAAATQGAASRIDRLEAAVERVGDAPVAVSDVQQTIEALRDDLRQRCDETARQVAAVDARLESRLSDVVAKLRGQNTAGVADLGTVRDAVASMQGVVGQMRERTEGIERHLGARIDAVEVAFARWREENAPRFARIDAFAGDDGRREDVAAAVGADVARLRHDLERTADDVHRLSVAAASQIAGAEDRATAVERMRAELQLLRDDDGRSAETRETRLASRVDEVVKALKAEALIARDTVAEQLTRIEGRLGKVEADAQATRAERQGTLGTVELALAEIHSELSALHQRRNGRPAAAPPADEVLSMLPWLVGRVRSQFSSELDTLGRLGGALVQIVRGATR